MPGKFFPPLISDLEANIPAILKSSRQFIPWRLEHEDRKVPLKPDGSSWGNYKDPKCWRTFDETMDLIRQGRAFGMGLALPSQKQIEALPEFNLIGAYCIRWRRKTFAPSGAVQDPAENH